MKKIYKMKNVIQDYAWGSIDAIPDLLGYENKSPVPQAELWMGSHRRGTSLLVDGNRNISLSDYIKDNANAVLGEDIASTYGDLPFLFKVLAAGSPLSIQVHPDKKQAEEGFLKENQLSIPLDAYNRNYKDNNHKPEIICALTPFWAMRGFRTFESIIQNFKKINLDSFKNEVNNFAHNSTSEGLKRFFNDIMSLEGDKKTLFINELVLKAKEFDEDTFQWVLKLYETYPDDSAIAAPLYLNLVHLNPGQALYLSAGELHAYLDGMGMELMASSDNVLRGGLTPKYIDRAELIKILNFSGADPEILSAGSKVGSVSIYNSPSKEFQLSRIDVDENYDYILDEKNRVQILFISDGEVDFLSEKGESIRAVKGESLFIPSHAGSWKGRGKAVLFRASVPGDID